MQGLEGIKVLELGTMVSAAYATKLMADLGADVIKVEEPQGDPARQRGPFPGGVTDPEQSGLFLYLNTNKRSVTGRIFLCRTIPPCDGRARNRVRHLS
jgi:crotonobetainyl-CoA:carnitine CoA-transferase CaiB-like acyl-CoA transferase